MKRRTLLKSILCVIAMPFVSIKEKIKVVTIKTHDEGEFVCEAKKECIDAFLKNYRAKNEKRLRAAGHKQFIPEITLSEMTREEYAKGPVTVKSALYFNAISI